MRQVKTLETNGYISFGKTKFDLDYKGVTLIGGLNLDARKDTEFTNGAGKSVLVGLFPRIIFDTIKGSKVQEQGSTTIRVKDDLYRLERTWGKKPEFKIYKNDKDTNVRTIALASAKAQAILGMTEEEFYSVAYVDVKRLHPLIMGSAAERLRYFTSMFRLHDTDALRKLLLQELRECETAAVTYKELVQQYKDIKGQTSAVNLKKLESRCVRLKEQAEDFTKVSEELHSLNELFEFKERYASLIVDLEKMKVEPDEVESQLKLRQEKAKSLHRMLEQAQEWKAEHKAIEAAKAKIAKIEEKLKLFGLTTSLKKARKGKKLLDKYRPRLEATEPTVKSLLKEQEEIEAGVAKLKHLKDVEAPNEGKLKELKRREVELEHELSHSKQFGSGKCPTCGSKVRARPSEDIKQELKQVRAKLETWSDLETYAALKARAKVLSEELSVLRDLRTALAAKVNKYERYAAAYEKLVALPELPEATVERPVLKASEVREQLEKNSRRQAILERAEPIVDLLKRAAKVTDKQKQRVADLRQQVKDLEDANAKLAVVESQIETEREKLKSLRRMKDKALELRAKAQDVPIIKTLLEVYSNKGLKKLMIQRYAQVIQDQLNKFRSILFSENFTFEITYDTKIQVVCHRHHGKKVKSSDVSQLSGAESRAFTLLLLLATLSLVPKSRRLNFLILDEADSNMGPGMFKNFLRFIPVLNKVIPHIIIVTPKNDVVYEGARVFTVVKQGGKSRLVKGRAHAKQR